MSERNLSKAQQAFMDEVKANGRYITPFVGGRNAGRVASAWYRTAASLQHRGLINLKRSGDRQIATLPLED